MAFNVLSVTRSINTRQQIVHFINQLSHTKSLHVSSKHPMFSLNSKTTGFCEGFTSHALDHRDTSNKAEIPPTDVWDISILSSQMSFIESRLKLR